MNLFSNGISSLFEETGEKLSDSQLIHRENERGNLLTITRLVLRSFLEQSMKTTTRVIESDIQSLCDLLMMIEKVLWHGFKSTAQKTVIFLKAPDADLWSMIVRIAKISEKMKETIGCVDQIDSLRLPICKVRAFLRISLMQKSLSDFFTEITQSPIIKEYYESWALIRHESIIYISGGLMGLKVLDCNLSLNSERLIDIPLSVDLTPYIKLPTISNADLNQFGSNSQGSSTTDDEKKRLLDQNSYLEERVRQLTCNMENMKKRLDSSDSRIGSQKGGLSLDTEMVSFRALEEANRRSTTDSAFQDERNDLIRQITEKDDSLRLIQQQLTDTKALNADLYLKLRHAEDCCRHLERDFLVEKQKHFDEIENLTKTNDKLTDRTIELERQLKRKKSNGEEIFSDLDKEFEKNQEDMSRSLGEIERTRSTLVKLKKEVANLSAMKEEYEKYNKKYGEALRNDEENSPTE